MLARVRADVEVHLQGIRDIVSLEDSYFKTTAKRFLYDTSSMVYRQVYDYFYGNTEEKKGSDSSEEKSSQISDSDSASTTDTSELVHILSEIESFINNYRIKLSDANFKELLEAVDPASEDVKEEMKKKQERTEMA
mmetsp:Transcript_3521/g.5254  ORF Transcript_3521/g.5254 Transcript_3521/m.5254 type:complete len:136 (+) Transcript_3521:23-430(+)